MPTIFQRIRDIFRAKAERRVERAETPDVLARTAVRESEAGLARLEVAAAAAIQAEVGIRAQGEKERRRAATFKQRAQTMAAQGDRDGAIAVMRQALLAEHTAAELADQADAMTAQNQELAAQVETRRTQRQIVRANAQVQQARWAGAGAARSAAEARYGRPGEVGSSPYELLERAEDRSIDEAAAGAALHVLNRRGVAGPDLAYRPDFDAMAEAEVDRLAPSASLRAGGDAGEEVSDAGEASLELPSESGG